MGGVLLQIYFHNTIENNNSSQAKIFKTRWGIKFHSDHHKNPLTRAAKKPSYITDKVFWK